MPQVQLPIFPAGVTQINSEVAFEERDGKAYYLESGKKLGVGRSE